MLVARFDIPESVREVINTAVGHTVIDAVSVYSMATEHGDNFRELVQEIVESAHADRLCNQVGHSAVCRAAERYWQESPIQHVPQRQPENLPDAKFEVGATYATRSICDSECVFSFRVVKRTAKMVTVQDSFGTEMKRRVALNNGSETIMPLGTYSMAPQLDARRDRVEV